MRIAVFDTETTGLPIHRRAPVEKQPYIIEYAIAHIEKGKVTKKFSTLIKPPVGVSDEITKITGLTDDDLKDAPTFAQAFSLVKESMDADVLIAHNLPFDESLLSFELARNGIELELPKLRICTAQLYHDEYGKRLKMKELYELKLGKPLDQTHRALDDVLALCEIVIKEKLWKLL